MPLAHVVAIMIVWQMVSHRSRCFDLYAEQSSRCYCHCDMWQMVSHRGGCCNLYVDYSKGLSESLKKVCSKLGAQVYFRGGKTIRSFLVAPKDKDPILKKSGVIYIYKCDRVESDEEYISLQEHLERGSRNTKRPHPQYMTIPTPLVMLPPKKISA